MSEVSPALRRESDEETRAGCHHRYSGEFQDISHFSFEIVMIFRLDCVSNWVGMIFTLDGVFSN